MKLSFSTRGWAELNWEELQDIALDQRFGGIEVYNLQAQPPCWTGAALFTGTTPPPPPGSCGRKSWPFPVLTPPVTCPGRRTCCPPCWN